MSTATSIRAAATRDLSIKAQAAELLADQQRALANVHDVDDSQRRRDAVVARNAVVVLEDVRTAPWNLDCAVLWATIIGRIARGPGS